MFDFGSLEQNSTGYFQLKWQMITFVLLIIILFYFYLNKKYDYWKSRGVPYEKPVFLFGNLWDVVIGKRQIAKHLGYLYTKFDTPYFGMYVFGKAYLVLRDPELIKTITISDFSTFDERSFDWEKTPDPLAGKSLFTLKNPHWKNIRGKISVIFTSGKLKQMFPFMKFYSKDMQRYLEKVDGNVVEAKEIASRYMTDIIGAFMFGFETNAFQDKGEDFRRNVKRMFKITPISIIRLFSYFLAPEIATWFNFQFMDSTYLQGVFLETIKKRKETKEQRNDFVDLLLKLKEDFRNNNSGTVFDTKTMLTQAIAFFLGGFETTSTIASYALYELCLKKDCQDRLRKEINEHVNEKAGVTFENLANMKYLDMVVLETLRRYPVSLFLNRRCKYDYVVPSTGLVIEKGTPIFIPVDGIHNDSKYYPEPEKFMPERFEDKKSYSQSGIFMPFGIGPRQCIGNRFAMIATKSFLVNVLQTFQLERCPETPVPLIVDTKSPFYHSRKPLKMVVKSCTKTDNDLS